VGAERAKIQTTDDSLACRVTDEKVSGDLKRAIIQGRTAKKMTQAQLAQVRSDTNNARPSPFVRHPSIHVPIHNDSGGCVGNGLSKSTRSRRLCRSTSRARPFPIIRCPPCTVSCRRAARCSARHCAPSWCSPCPSAHVETRCAATWHACRCSGRWSEFWESSCAARNRSGAVSNKTTTTTGLGYCTEVPCISSKCTGTSWPMVR
jgi:hypothetical protein